MKGKGISERSTDLAETARKSVRIHMEVVPW